MGFRFRRRVQIAKGLNLNLSRRGASLSVGRPGATLNVSGKGTRATAGLPGTGLSYTTTAPARGPSPRRKAGGAGSLVLGAVLLFFLLRWLIG